MSDTLSNALTKRQEYQKKWRSENMEHLRAYSRSRYREKKKKDPEALRKECGEKVKLYRLRHPEKLKAYMKKWRQTDKAKASKKLSAKRRYLRHKEKIDRANANYRLVKNYGITLDQRTAMLAGQNGMCALCGEVLGEKKHTAIDHCHKTGKVRGILHRMCNVLIGTAHEREELLQKAIDYLRRHA